MEASKKLGVVVMMLMMVGVVMGQSVDLDDLVDYSLSDIQPLENSAPLKKTPATYKIPEFPPQNSPPKFHVPPPPHPKSKYSCLSRCQKNCSNDRVTARKSCFDSCPSKCNFDTPSDSLKNCIIDCIKAIPTNYAPAFAVEENMRGRLNFCYKTCSSRIRVHN